MLDDQIGAFEAVPPYPPRTEREAEFYSLRDGEMFLNMGPQHPSTHGVLRVVLKINGEQVVDLDPVLGYLHRGVEKLCENSDYHHIISQVDPLEYVELAVQRVGAGDGVRAAARRRRSRAARSTSACSPASCCRISQPRAVPGLDGARPRRPDADPVQLHRARRDRRDAGRDHRPADAVQLLPHRRRERRPQPRVHVPPRRLDEPRGRAARGEHRAAQRERDLRPPDARHRPAWTATPRCGWPSPARTCAPPASRSTSAARTPYSRLPGARVRHPGPRHRPRGRRLASTATCSASTRSSRASGSSTSACTTCPTGRSWPACRACCGRARVARGRPSRRRAACTARTRSRDGTDQPFRMKIHDPSFVNLQLVGMLMKGNLIADTMAVMAQPRPDHGRHRQVTRRCDGWRALR